MIHWQMIDKRLARQLVSAVLFVLATIVCGFAGAQSPDERSGPFNHNTTGFMLEGAHLKQACESCHTQGSFRGTPRDCAGCHRAGGRSPGKPIAHIQTSANCDACHLNTSWAPSTFTHRVTQGITQGACSSCHNGGGATGKPATHLVTSSQCDSCHKSSPGSSWLPAGYTHALVVPGTCATCHNGNRATGKPGNHIPTSASCDACHAPGVAFAPISVGVNAMHTSMSGPAAVGSCSSCHNGSFVAQNAQAKTAAHINTSLQCDTCHNSSFTSWATTTFDHSTVPTTGLCSNCHDGAMALGKPSSHVPTGAQCDTCHTNFAAFKPAKMSHVNTSGQCASCHNGSYNFANAQAKPGSHIPTSAQCDTCHVKGFVNWSPATMDHAGSAGKCANCHSGSFVSSNAQTKPATHVGTKAQCDSCHTSTTSWATAVFDHAKATPAVTGRCSGCHNSVTALGKPTNHIPTAAQCDNCHKNLVAFKPAGMDHSGTAGQCASCHSGSYTFANALARPVGHIPTLAPQCDSCHNSTTAWSPAVMSHTGTAGLCSACHNGTYLPQNAQTKPLTHVSTGAQCDSCHKSTTSWATATYDHALANPAATGRCGDCHNSVNALGKPVTHIPTTAPCDSCHKNYTAFRPAIMDHTGAVGQCSTCHGGSHVSQNALTKPPTHVSTTAQCDTCHNSTVMWKSAIYVHTASAPGSCSNCHNGNTALGKAVTHLPTAAQCDTCHKNFVAFKPANMDHSGTAAQCANCHSGSYTAVNALGKAQAPTTHIPSSAQCDTCHNNTLNFKPARMDHAGLSGQCDSCHIATFVGVNALAKPVGHIPTSAQCDSCHSNGFVNWSPANMNHTGTGSGTATPCATCHSGTYLAQNAQAATHAARGACDSSGCHASTISWATAGFNHATATPAVAGRCASCHNNVQAIGKPATSHIPTRALECDKCHAVGTSFRPISVSGYSMHSVMTSPTAAGHCTDCHTSGFTGANAQTKPLSHIPTATYPQCESCHKTTAWKPTTFTHQGVVAGSCATCHNGTGALGMTVATHVPTTASCDACHTTYSAFTPAKMNHAAVTVPLASVGAHNCATCHAGKYLGINAQIKPLTHVATANECDTCHTSTATWATASYTHETTAVGKCSTCHNSVTALGKPTTHIPTTAQCDTCHKNYNGFRPAQMSHVGTTGPTAVANCSSCHSGTYLSVNALSKPASHIPTTLQCDTCHTKGYTAWNPPVMNHTGLTGQCITCHTGAYLLQNAQIKTATHIPTTAQCDTCHKSTTTWATGTFNHANVAGTCTSCHNGTNALGKPTNHIPTAAECDSCHTNFTAFTPAAMSHALTTGPVATGRCSACHSGSFVAQNALAKPLSHITTSAQCDTCHSSTTAWKPATYTHAGTATGTCSTCHNGATALGKSVAHIPTTAQCDTCHTSYTGFAKPGMTMTHAGTSGPLAVANCSVCHSGTFVAVNALPKPGTHIPTNAQCDSCHTAGYAAWTPSAMNHTGTTAKCDTCHDGSYTAVRAFGKLQAPTTHVSTVAQCDTCHKSTVSWASATFDHAAANPAAPGNCNSAGCHRDGNVSPNPIGKPAGTAHIPTTLQCDTCHRNYSSFKPAAMNHIGTTGQCITCHGASTYLAQNALTKPLIHVVTGAQCDTCHSSTVTWKLANYAHDASAAGNCSNCHNGTTALGKPAATHIPTSAQCDTCHDNKVAFKPAKMSHTGTVGQCSTCHSGMYTAANALGKQQAPTTHITTSAQCDSCHTNTINFKPAFMNHSGTAGQCISCHDGSKTAINAKGKPAGNLHIPTSAQCDTCHTNPNAPDFTAQMNHSGMAGQCSTCHNATYAPLNALAKPLGTLHIPTAAQCDTCHTNTVNWAPAMMNHTGMGGTANPCATCHSGTYAALNAQSATHAPRGACDSSGCHSSTVSWATATYNHALANPPVIGRCSSCHNNVQAIGKPAGSHIPTGLLECDKCHAVGTSFRPISVSVYSLHSVMTTPTAAGNCTSCHNGGYLAVNAQTKPLTHIPTTTYPQCESCHKTTAWKPTTFSHQGVVAGSCATCHDGVKALGKVVSTHLPTTASCDSCHTSYTAFAPARMNHSAVTIPLASVGAHNCSSCHAGKYIGINAQVKSATHVSTTNECDTCHTNTASWATGVSYTHEATAVGRCSTCHGVNALAKPSNHIPTTAQCDTCHKNYNAFRPAVMSHPGTLGPVAVANCSTCHSGTYVSVNALSKPGTHIPTSLQCDTCHSKGYTTWTPSVMNHIGLAGQCISCHTGAYVAQNAQIKTPTHISTTAQCDTCHKSTSSWATVSFNHANVTPAVTARCSTCHNGTNALGKPTSHIPTTAQCDTCHNNFVAFAPAAMNHTGTAGKCTTCHSGSFVSVNAQVKPATHIVTTQQCEVCHLTTVWLPTSFAHTALQINGKTCSQCHDGLAAVGKKAPHIPTTAGEQCSACHRTGISWLPLITPYPHTGASTTCVSCHISSYPNIDVQPVSGHIPQGLNATQCGSCHLKTSWLPVRYTTHTGTCSTCHSGTYKNITGKPALHIPTTLAGMPGNECSNCHKTTANWAVTTAQMVSGHGTISLNCRTCHMTGTNYLGNMEKLSVTHEKKTATDCANSGCHRPGGSKGNLYTKWN